MASVGGDGGDKLNVELNLVPFIDLLSTLVLFLLVTTVWLQVAAIPAAVKSKGQASVATPTPSTVDIHVTANGYQLSWPAALAKKGFVSAIPRKGKIYDVERLQKALTMASATKALSGATVSSDDGVPYGRVIEAVDAAKGGGGLSVGLSTN